MKFKMGDKVKIIKVTGSLEKSEFIGKVCEINYIASLANFEYPNYLEGIEEYSFSDDELELANELKVPINQQWFGKKYEWHFYRGHDYRTGKEYQATMESIKGKLINFDDPFTGRFFIENEDGGLEIILMESVVDMREIIS